MQRNNIIYSKKISKHFSWMQVLPDTAYGYKCIWRYHSALFSYLTYRQKIRNNGIQTETGMHSVILISENFFVKNDINKESDKERTEVDSDNVISIKNKDTGDDNYRCTA